MPPFDRQAAFSGIKSTPAAIAVHTDLLTTYLSVALPGFAGPLTIRQFKGGQSNPTYLLETPTRRYVLRRKPPGKLLPSAHAVDREYRVIAALAAQGFPVAAPLVYCDQVDIVGTPFYVMAFVEGRVFWEPHMPASHPRERAEVYDILNVTIARLHAYDPATIGLGDFGRGENYVARQIARWSKQYRASETEEIADMERLIAWLPDNAPPPAPTRLVHGDYRLDNVILAAQDADILAVLDWELSTLGDPLADFSYHLMQWFMPPSDVGVGTLAGHDLDALGIPGAEDYAARYAQRTGLDPRPHLPAYLAYNFFRLAAIYQGIAGRVRDGTAASENAYADVALVRSLAQRGWAFAREADAKAGSS